MSGSVLVAGTPYVYLHFERGVTCCPFTVKLLVPPPSLGFWSSSLTLRAKVNFHPVTMLVTSNQKEERSGPMNVPGGAAVHYRPFRLCCFFADRYGVADSSASRAV